MEDDHYEKRLVDDSQSDVTKATSVQHVNGHVNQLYSTQIERKQQHTELHHHVAEGDTDSGAEMYSLDDLPRVSSLNEEEVRHI